MLDGSYSESLAVTETRLIHDSHRVAAALLADAAQQPAAPPAALAELRDFVVSAIRHHHESEDTMLWPLLWLADPGSAAALEELTGEHHRLNAALDALAAAGTGRTELTAPAATVRDLVSQHLDREEFLTFPLLRRLTGAQWAGFARAVLESVPASVAALQIAFMAEVGAPQDVAAVLAGVPAPVAGAILARREQGLATLGALRSAAGGDTWTRSGI